MFCQRRGAERASSSVQWSYAWVNGIGLAYAASYVLQCARCRHARFHAQRPCWLDEIITTAALARYSTPESTLAIRPCVIARPPVFA